MNIYVLTYWSDREVGFTELFEDIDAAKRFSGKSKWRQYGRLWICESNLGVYRIRSKKVRLLRKNTLRNVTESTIIKALKIIAASPKERRKAIKKLRASYSVKDIAKLICVSESWVRRNL